MDTRKFIKSIWGLFVIAAFLIIGFIIFANDLDTCKKELENIGSKNTSLTEIKTYLELKNCDLKLLDYEKYLDT